MSKRAFIFLNGNYSEDKFNTANFRADDLIIGVDGGSEYLLSMGKYPHIIIGDLDSIDPNQLHHIKTKGTRILRYPPHKNETDFELALEHAIQQGCRSIWVYGAIGGRIDQTLANIMLSVQYAACGMIHFVHGCEEIFLITDKIVIHGKRGDIISLIPISGNVCGIKTTGLTYPLQDEILQFGKTRGISNVMERGEASILLTSGILLCIHIHQMSVNIQKRS